MTILDCCISLKMIKKILVVLGVVNMCQLLLSAREREQEEKRTRNSAPISVNGQNFVAMAHMHVLRTLAIRTTDTAS